MFKDFIDYTQTGGHYKKGTVKLFHYYIGTFSKWLTDQGITDLSVVTEEMVQQFLDASDWANNTKQIFRRFYLKNLLDYYKNGPQPAPEQLDDGGNGRGDMAGAEAILRGEEEPKAKVTPIKVTKRSRQGVLRQIPTKQDVLKQLPPREMFKFYGMDQEGHSTPIGAFSMRDIMPWGGIEPFVQQELSKGRNYKAYHVFLIDEGGSEVPQTTVRPLAAKPGEQQPYIETLEEIRKQQQEDHRERAKKLDELTATFTKAWSEGRTSGSVAGGADPFGQMMQYRLVKEFFGHMDNRGTDALDLAIQELKRMQAEAQVRTAQGQAPLSPMEKLTEMKMMMAMIDEMFPPRRRRSFDDEEEGPVLPPLPPPLLEPRRSTIDEAKSLVEMVFSFMPKSEARTDPAVLAQLEVMRVQFDHANRRNEELSQEIKGLVAERNHPPSTFERLAVDLKSARELLAEFGGGAGAGKGEKSMVDFLDNLVDRLPEIMDGIGRVAALPDRKDRLNGGKGKEKEGEKGQKRSADGRRFVKLLEGAKDDKALMRHMMLLFHRVAASPEKAQVAKVILMARGNKLRAYVGKILDRLPFEGKAPKSLRGRIVRLIEANRASMLKSLTAAS